STPINTATGIRGEGREPLRELRARWGDPPDRPAAIVVPCQSAMGTSPSATRLTQRVPWLCDPASRRVCVFGDLRRDRSCVLRGVTSGQFVTGRSTGVGVRRAQACGEDVSCGGVWRGDAWDIVLGCQGDYWP